MKLNEGYRTFFDLIPVIMQTFATDALYSIAILSVFLGNEFYRLRPKALVLSIPLFFLTSFGRAWWFQSQSRYIKTIHDSIRPKTPDQDAAIQIANSKQKDALNFEKRIYLFIYFISDIITGFELSSILASALFHLNLMYANTILFPLSICYALWIHSKYRSVDFATRYDNLIFIMREQPIKTPIQTGTASFSTFLCIIGSIAVIDTTPLLALVLFVVGVACCLRYFKENAYSLYCLVLFDFSMRRLVHINQLLSHHLRFFNFGISVPAVNMFTSVASTSLALCYAGAYICSTTRERHLKNLYDEIKQVQHDPVITATNT